MYDFNDITFQKRQNYGGKKKKKKVSGCRVGVGREKEAEHREFLGQ